MHVIVNYAQITLAILHFSSTHMCLHMIMQGCSDTSECGIILFSFYEISLYSRVYLSLSPLYKRWSLNHCA